jgi:hypothetical protein
VSTFEEDDPVIEEEDIKHEPSKEELAIEMQKKRLL